MSRRPAMRPGPASLALFFAALILYGSAFAQDEVPPGTIHELRRADLSGAPGMEVITSRIEYQPGQGVRLHSHHGVETGYVIQGAMIQMPGKEPTMLQTGATIWNLRDVPHGGYRVVGDTPLVLLTVHIVDKESRSTNTSGDSSTTSCEKSHHAGDPTCAYVRRRSRLPLGHHPAPPSLRPTVIVASDAAEHLDAGDDQRRATGVRQARYAGVVQHVDDVATLCRRRGPQERRRLVRHWLEGLPSLAVHLGAFDGELGALRSLRQDVFPASLLALRT